jgi:hypothetical protein
VFNPAEFAVFAANKLLERAWWSVFEGKCGRIAGRKLSVEVVVAFRSIVISERKHGVW